MATILAVDDSASMRQMVSFTLKSAGFDVIEAADGQQAFDKAKTTKVDFDEAEDIEIVLVPKDRIIELIRNGTIHHSMMVAALSMYLIHEKF